MIEVEGEHPNGDAAGEPVALAPLTDSADLLFRQVHPHFYDGEPTNGAFRPGSKDVGELSVGRESLTTAEEVFVRHTQGRGFQSVGTWAVTVGEIAGAKLNAIPDPLPDDPSHGFVDFRGLGRGQCGAKSKILRRHALARGCLYRP